MQLSQTDHEGITLIRLAGRFDELAAVAVEPRLAPLLESACLSLVFDLSEVDYISSSGLRILLMVSKATARRGGQLRLCGLTPFVAEVLDVSNLATIFDIRTTVEKALASLREVASAPPRDD